MTALRGLSKLIGASVGLAVLAMAAPAQASLLGQTITCVDTFFTCTPASATVIEPGLEFHLATPAGFNIIEVDIGDMSVRMTLPAAVGGGGFTTPSQLTLGDLIWSNDLSATITGIANLTISNIAGLDAGDITTFANSVVIDYQDTEWQPDAFVSFDLVTTHDVPAPPALAVFLIALVGLGVARRRAG